MTIGEAGGEVFLGASLLEIAGALLEQETLSGVALDALLAPVTELELEDIAVDEPELGSGDAQ